MKTKSMNKFGFLQNDKWIAVGLFCTTRIAVVFRRNWVKDGGESTVLVQWIYIACSCRNKLPRIVICQLKIRDYFSLEQNFAYFYYFSEQKMWHFIFLSYRWCQIVHRMQWAERVDCKTNPWFSLSVNAVCWHFYFLLRYDYLLWWNCEVFFGYLTKKEKNKKFWSDIKSVLVRRFGSLKTRF